MPRMSIQEIKDHNKVNMNRLTTKQLECLLNDVPGLEPMSDHLFKSKIRFDRYVRVAGKGVYELRKGKPDKYACTLILWDKETNDLYSILQFGFSNRNRLRNRLQALQKQWDNIVCRIISINEV